MLAVYTGSSLGGLTLVAKNDDIVLNTNTASSVTFPVTQGQIYRVVVNGYNNGGSGGDTGNIKLNWSESSCSVTAPSLLIEQGTTNRAVALDSVTFVRGPFPVIGLHNFSADQHTRVILFTSNLGLAQPPFLTVQASGVPLTVENVGPISGVTGLSASYIVVRLPDGLPTNVDLSLTVTWNGATSNTALLGISP